MSSWCLALVCWYAGGFTCRLVSTVRQLGLYWAPVLVLDALLWFATMWLR